MGGSLTPNAQALGDYVARSPRRVDPPEVVEVARKCLADWLAVALAVRDDPVAAAVHNAARRWDKGGQALVLRGGRAGALAAALINGTMAHCLDFDDTHVGSTTHFSAPVWAAVMALGAEVAAEEGRLLSAFVTGYEVGARIGRGLGPAVTALGWHSTGVAGRLGAAASCAALLGLDAVGTAHALGTAATQVGGLTASFGTMSKPFHVGKAAMDGILSAELAADGFIAATDLLEAGGALPSALIQDRRATIGSISFDNGWEILGNTFKFYAACLLVHPAIDAARSLSRRVHPEEIVAGWVKANPLAVQLASGREPVTANEAKFSIPFCVALGLSGYAAGPGDFVEENLHNSTLRRLAASVEVEAADLPSTAAVLHITLTNGETVSADIPTGRDPRWSWNEMERKFVSVLNDVLPRERALGLLAALRSFGAGGGLEAIEGAVSAARPLSTTAHAAAR